MLSTLLLASMFLLSNGKEESPNARQKSFTVDKIGLPKSNFTGIFQELQQIKRTTKKVEDTDETEMEKLSYIELFPDGTQVLHKIKSENKGKLQRLKKSREGNHTLSHLADDDRHEEGQRRLYVFDPDNRVQITSATYTPVKQTGYVYFQDASGGIYHCSGTMIGPKTVLTAGHCVHSGGSSGDWYSSFYFCPGRVSATCNQWYYASAVSVSGWVNSGDWDYDYAVLQLTSAPNIGWISFGYSSAISTDWYFYSHGYPGDKSSGTMWQTSCYPSEVNTRQIEDQSCDIYFGQSGSHMYSYAYNGNRVIFGIVSHQSYSCYWFFGYYCTYWNAWTRIVSSSFTTLCDLIDDSSVC